MHAYIYCESRQSTSQSGQDTDRDKKRRGGLHCSIRSRPAGKRACKLIYTRPWIHSSTCISGSSAADKLQLGCKINHPLSKLHVMADHLDLLSIYLSTGIQGGYIRPYMFFSKPPLTNTHTPHTHTHTHTHTHNISKSVTQLNYNSSRIITLPFHKGSM